MADVFISYKSERRAAAKYLAAIISAHGFSVWFDYDLVPGKNFGRHIETELRQAKAVVVLWCRLSVCSDWVQEEAHLAKKLGTFLPTRIEECDPPLGFRLDDFIDISGWDGDPSARSLDRLLDRIEALVGRGSVVSRRSLQQLHSNWDMLGRPRLRQFALGHPREIPEEDRRLPSGRDNAEKPVYLTAEQDWLACRSEDSSRSIPASTRLIQSGTLAPKKLALAHNARACGFVRAGRFDEALADFSAAIALEPDNTTYYINRGGLYLEKKDDVNSALRDLGHAMGLDPDHPDAECFKLLGKLHLKEKRYAQAISFFDRAIERPDVVSETGGGAIASVAGYLDLPTYFYRGQAHEKLANRKQAIEDYQLVAIWPVSHEDDEAKELQIQAKARLLHLNQEVQ